MAQQPGENKSMETNMEDIPLRVTTTIEEHLQKIYGSTEECKRLIDATADEV